MFPKVRRTGIPIILSNNHSAQLPTPPLPLRENQCQSVADTYRADRQSSQNEQSVPKSFDRINKMKHDLAELLSKQLPHETSCQSRKSCHLSPHLSRPAHQRGLTHLIRSLRDTLKTSGVRPLSDASKLPRLGSKSRITIKKAAQRRRP